MRRATLARACYLYYAASQLAHLVQRHKASVPRNGKGQPSHQGKAEPTQFRRHARDVYSVRWSKRFVCAYYSPRRTAGF